MLEGGEVERGQGWVVPPGVVDSGWGQCVLFLKGYWCKFGVGQVPAGGGAVGDTEAQSPLHSFCKHPACWLGRGDEETGRSGIRVYI